MRATACESLYWTEQLGGSDSSREETQPVPVLLDKAACDEWSLGSDPDSLVKVIVSEGWSD